MRTRRILAWVVAAAALLAVPAGTASASNPASPSKRHRDAVWKFSFMTFDDWPPIPLETQGSGMFQDPIAKYQAVKFVQKDDFVTGGRFRAGALEVFRMGKAPVGGETTGDGKPPGVKVVRGDEPKSMEELLGQVAKRTGGIAVLDPKAAKTIKSKDDVPGQMWTVDRGTNGGVYMVLAMWKKDDVEVGMWIACESVLKKKFELGFQRIVSSFTWFDDKAEDVRSLDVLNGLRISARKRREIEKGLVKNWDVIVSPNKNYVVIYNRNGRRNDRLARTLAERIELIRAQVYEVQFPPAKAVQAVSVVRVCGDAFEYHSYGGPRGSAGYWSDDTEELVFYDANPKEAAPDDDTLAVLYHEAFHQYIYYSVGKVAPHSWFNEGHGDYYAGSRYGGSKFTIRPFNWRVARVKNAIKKGPCAYEEAADADGDVRFKFDRSNEGYSPLKALVRLSQGEYYSYPSISYAQGWSLVYFLREIVPKNKDWNAKWGRILETYFATLKAEVNKETPLIPKVVEPDDGGMGEPGMGEPGMDDPGMDDPGMDDPGMDDPGMDDPGMSDPGMGDEPGGMGGDEPPPEDGIAVGFMRFESSRKALKKAIEEAFKGVDFDELETAWKASILKIPDPPPRR